MTQKFNIELLGNDNDLNSYFTGINTLENTDQNWLNSLLHRELEQDLSTFVKVGVTYTYDATTNVYNVTKVEYHRSDGRVIAVNHNDGFLDGIVNFWKDSLFKDGSTVEKKQALYHHLVINYFNKFQSLFEYIQFELNKDVKFRWVAGSFKRTVDDVEAFYNKPYDGLSPTVYSSHAFIQDITGFIDRFHPHESLVEARAIDTLHFENYQLIQLLEKLNHAILHEGSLRDFALYSEKVVGLLKTREVSDKPALDHIHSYVTNSLRANLDDSVFKWVDNFGHEHTVNIKISEVINILSKIVKNTQTGVDVTFNNEMLIPLMHHVLHDVLLANDKDLLNGLLTVFAPNLTAEQKTALLNKYVVRR